MPGGLRGGSKIPAGEAQRNFPVPRGHAPHPLPPPVRKVGGGEWLVGTGGGRLFYTSHFKGGADAPPLEPPLQQAWTKRALGGKGSWCPVGTAQDRPRRQPRPEPPYKIYILKKELPLPRQHSLLFQKSIGVGGGRGWAPLPPPPAAPSHLPVRSAQNALHRRAAPP